MVMGVVDTLKSPPRFLFYNRRNISMQILECPRCKNRDNIQEFGIAFEYNLRYKNCHCFNCNYKSKKGYFERDTKEWENIK